MLYMFTCLFKGMCCVLNLKIVAWSLLPSLSISSFVFGVVMYLNKIQPVFPFFVSYYFLYFKAASRPIMKINVDPFPDYFLFQKVPPKRG